MLLEKMSTDRLDVKNWKEDFTKQGYVICKGFFSPEEMKTLWENLQAADIKEKTYGWDEDRLKYHTHFLSRSSKIRALIAQPKVVEVLSQIIGPNIWVRWDQAISKDPGAGMMPWHQDNRYSQLKHPYYQFWIPLTKMTPENGGLWIQPGSYWNTKKVLPHRVVEGQVAYEGVPESPLFIDAEPGDIVVFSSFLLHCTTSNTTNQSRWSYIVECLSLDHFDPIIKPPYLVLAQNGQLAGEYANFYQHRLNPVNLFHYWVFQLKILWYRSPRPLVNRLRQAVQKSSASKAALQE